MKRRLAIAGALLCAGISSNSAHAQLFVCTAPNGRTISADRPPPECADKPIRELRPDGSVRRVIEPPPTAEQKAARAAEEKRQIDAAEKQRAQMRRDLALLETYADEKEIENSRNRALADRQTIIDRANARMAQLAKDKKRLADETEFYAKAKMPEKLRRDLESNAESIKSQEKIIGDTRADMQRVNDRFDAEAQRFRELVAGGARPVQR